MYRARIFFLIFCFLIIGGIAYSKENFQDVILDTKIACQGQDKSIRDILTKGNKIINLKISDKSNGVKEDKRNILDIYFTILGKNIAGIAPLYYNAISINALMHIQQDIVGGETVFSKCIAHLKLMEPYNEKEDFYSCDSLLKEIERNEKFDISNLNNEKF